MKQKKNGFTLAEVLVVLMVLSILMGGMLTLLLTSANTLKSMEKSLTNKTQYQRSVSFISNTIRRNQKKGAVQIKEGSTINSGSRLVIALADLPGKYLHYYKLGADLVMYIGTESEDRPNIKDDDNDKKKQYTMILAKNIESISFEFEEDSNTKKRTLRVQYEIKTKAKDKPIKDDRPLTGDEAERLVTTTFVDRINLYVTN